MLKGLFNLPQLSIGKLLKSRDLHFPGAILASALLSSRPSDTTTPGAEFQSNDESIFSPLQDPSKYFVEEARHFPLLFLGIAMINLLVWSFQKIYPELVEEHFVPSLTNYLEGRPWSALLGVFSHQYLLTFLTQMYIFLKLGDVFYTHRILSDKGLNGFIIGTIFTTAYLPLAIEYITMLLFPKSKVWLIERHPGFWGVNVGLLYLFLSQLPKKPLQSNNWFLVQSDRLLTFLSSLITHYPYAFWLTYLLFQSLWSDHVDSFNLHILVGWMAGFAAKIFLTETSTGRENLSNQAYEAMK
eukprot:gene9832-10872_t